MAAQNEPQRNLSTSERILRSLTGTNIVLGSSHPFAESVNESNSDKSDEDDLESSRRDDAD